MSSRKRDLIERVRYPNPIPIPPFPPKLTQLDNPSTLYAHPDFSQRLANAHPIPTVVDAEAGMPLNLLAFEGIWNNAGKRDGLADDSVAPQSSPILDPTELDPEDAYLLSDLSSALPAPTATTSNPLPTGAAALGTQAPAKDITWLRRTEYLAAEQAKSRTEAIRKRPTVSIDTSLEAHISRIQSTFEKASTPLSSLRHPTKPNLRAIDSYQVLPDRDTWSTSYQILKFVDWPGRTSQKDGKPVVDERITNGLFRPVMDSNGEQRMSLYLPSADGFEGEEMDDGKSKERKEDEMAARFSKRRRTGKFPKAKTQEEMNGELEGVEDEEEKIKLEEKEGQRISTSFRFTRDYEPIDQGREVRSQLVLVLDDGIPDPSIIEKDNDISDPHVDSNEYVSNGIVNGKGKGRELSENGDLSNLTVPPQSKAENIHRKGCKDGNHIGGIERNRKIAYFHPIDMRYGLRIKRVKKHEQHSTPDFWDTISLVHRDLTEREAEKRANSKRTVDEIDLDYIESEAEDQDENLVNLNGDEEERGIRLGDQIKKIDVAAEGKSSKLDEEDGEGEGEGEDGEGSEGSEKDGNGTDDDDEEIAEGEEMDSDEEMANLKAEAGDAGDDENIEFSGRGRRSRNQPVVEASGEMENQGEAGQKENESNGNQNGDAMDVDEE